VKEDVELSGATSFFFFGLNTASRPDLFSCPPSNHAGSWALSVEKQGKVT